MPDSQPAAGAVFLSYAREDSESARRIADGLRAFGVEVWFDQSELRGGDAWDAKIKAQIRSCALFVPIISVQTQKRTEGYFRREWKIGVERTHDMAAGRAFVVPIVVDETRESEALVPEEFMRVQWTRLLHGVPTPQFIEQIKGLLANPHQARTRDAPATPRADTVSVNRSPRRVGLVAAAIAAVAAVGIGAFLLSRRPAPAPAAVAPAVPEPHPVTSKSVAVLPFANFSPDKDNEFFADGLQDEVITALAKIHDLKVISRTSVLPYRNPEGRNLKKIGSELGVATVLEGSVQRVGSKVHLNVQLIDARTDDHLWAESYTEDLTDVFSLESALAERIAAALKAGLTSDEKALIDRRPTQNREAYDLYLRAMVLSESLPNTATASDYEPVLLLFAQAAARDPEFSLPHVQASILHDGLYWYSTLDSTEPRKQKALAELQIAERLAPTAPETRMAEGEYKYACLNDWSAALEDYRVSAAALPNDSQVNNGIGRSLRRLGRLSESVPFFRKASDLDPNDQASAFTIIQTLGNLHRYAEALAAAEHFTPRFPDDDYSRAYAAAARFQLDGDHSAYIQALVSRNPYGDTAPTLVVRHAMFAGNFAAADQAIVDGNVQWIPEATGAINSPASLYRAYFAYLAGRKDEARTLAQAAIKVYRETRWSKRQLFWVPIGVAYAEAYSGDMEAAARDGREAVAEMKKQDAYDASLMLFDYGRILVIAGHNDEALGVLDQMMASPLEVPPRALSYEPIWSRLATHPRFGEILGSVRPL